MDAVVRSSILTAMLLCSGLAAAAQWRLELPAERDVPLLADVAIPLPDGGFVTASGPLPGWVMRFDRDANSVALAPTSAIYGRNALAREGRVVFRGFGPSPFFTPTFHLDRCRIERRLPGLTLQALMSLEKGETDVEGGFFEADPFMPRIRGPELYRFRSDCVAEPLQHAFFAYYPQVMADPGAVGAYAIGSSSSEVKGLARMDDRGVRWARYQYEFGANATLELLGVQPTGIAVVGWTEEDRYVLAGFDRDGAISWRHEDTYPDAAYFHSLSVWPDIAVVVDSLHASFSTPRKTLLVTLEHDGDPQSAFELPEGALGGRLASANEDGGIVFVLNRRHVENEEHVVFELRPGPALLERLRLPIQSQLERWSTALAELRDGRILVSDADGGLLVHDGPDSTPVEAVGDVLPRKHSIFRLIPAGEPGSAYLLVAREQGSPYLLKSGPQGEPVWRVTLSGKPDPLLHGLAATAERVCVSSTDVDRTERDPRLRCLDARTGQSRFELPGIAVPLQSDDRIHWIQTEYDESGVATITRRTVAGDGQIHDSILGIGSALQLSAPGPDGQIAVHDTETGELSVIAGDGSVAWGMRLEAGVVLYATEDGGVLVLVELQGETDAIMLRRLGLGGAVRWERVLSPVPAGVEAAHGAAIRPLGHDWLIVDASGSVQSGGSQEVTMRRLSDEDGSESWSKTEVWNDRRSIAAVSSDGRAFVVAPFEATGETWWYDALDGRRLGAIATSGGLRESFFSPQAFSFSSGRRLLRAFEETDAAGMRVVLDAHDPSELLPTGGATVDLLSGSWYAPVSSGQGIHFVLAEGTASGLWTTYGNGRGNDPANQRWYRTSVRPLAPGKWSLGFDAPTAGSFDSGATSVHRIGTGTWTQTGCDQAVLDYRLDGSGAQGEGAISLRRLFPSTRCGSDGGDAAEWRETDGSESTLHVLRSDGEGDGVVAIWPILEDGDGPASERARWFTLAGSVSNGLEIYRTLGGRLATGRTSNTMRVGEARVHWHSCSQLRMDYRFDDSDVARPFAGREGTLELERVGDCPGGSGE